MTQRDDLLHRVMAANPLPIEVDLPDEVVDARPPLALLISEERSPMTDPSTGPSGKKRRWWTKPATVFATVFLLILAAIGIVAILTNGQPEFVDEPSPSTTTMDTATTNIVTTTTMIPPSGAWDPILATTRSKAAPPAASCSPATNPSAPGLTGRERPRAGWNGNLKGVFDRHAGRIVYVVAGKTWTFDVCANTWQDMHPAGAPEPSGTIISVVYDTDSDVTVAFGYERISVYDANTNTWTQPENETVGIGDDLIVPIGAAYDPVSGLIITTTMSVGDPDRWDVWAYDVDTNIWTPIGAVPLDRDPPCCTQIDLFGYSHGIDRLILATYVGDQEVTLLVDPRSGEATQIATDTPVVDLVWPSGSYGPAADTVYVKQPEKEICGFDTSILTWSDCFDTPTEIRDNLHTVFAAMVGDPINQRLILINSVGDDLEATDDVWAIDLGTGQWTQLIAPSGGEADAGIAPGTITVAHDGLEGFEGLAIEAWVLSLEPSQEKEALGGAY